MNGLSINDRIVNLKQDLDSYNNEIMNLIQSQYQGTINPSNNSIDMNSDPRNALILLRQELNELISEYKGQSNATSEDLKECNDLCKLLETISLICNQLLTFDELLCGYDLKAIVNSVISLDKLFNNLPAINSQFGTGRVCMSLRRELITLKSRFDSKLLRLFKNIFIIEHGRIFICKFIKGVIPNEESIIETPISLTDIWLAIHYRKLSSKCLSDLIDRIWYNLFIPLYKEKRINSPRIQITSDSSELIYDSIVKEINNDNINNNKSIDKTNFNLISKLPINTLFDNIGQIFLFINNEILCNLTELTNDFNLTINSNQLDIINKLCNTIIVNIPKLEVDLSTYNKLIEKSCNDLDHLLSNSNCLSSDSKPLTNTCNNIINTFITQKRQEILSKCRDIILSDYHNVMLATGDALDDELASSGAIGDPSAMLDNSGSFAIQTLKFEQCQISLTVCRLLKYINDIMKSITSITEEALVNNINQSVRDGLDLFISLIPIKYSNVIENSSKMGAIYYNDCLYIAHNCTLITHRYRSTRILFIDLITKLRSSKDKLLQIHINRYINQLDEYIKLININPSIDSKSLNQPRRSKAIYNNEDGIRQLIDYFNMIKSDWFNVLQENIYERIVGYLIDYTLRKFIDILEQCDCITEYAASDMNRLFKSIQQIKNVFENGNQLGYIDRVVVSWSKFCSLTDLLEYTLTDIAEWLPKFKFSSFTSKQLSSLIIALFEDSPKRQSVLAAINEVKASK